MMGGEHAAIVRLSIGHGRWLEEGHHDGGAAAVWDRATVDLPARLRVPPDMIENAELADGLNLDLALAELRGGLVGPLGCQRVRR